MLLWQKEKTIKIEQEDTIIKISAYFKDSFHEMSTTITINSDSMMILAAEVNIITVPWDICHEIVTKMEGLVGLTIKKGIKQKVQEVLGGAQGCVHLVELTMDSIISIIQVADFYLLPKEMTFEERMEKIKAINKGICHTYSNLDRNPKLQEIEASKYKPIS